MMKRLFLSAVFMLALPIWFSPDSGEKLLSSAPFATVAIAGHVTSAGVYCDCTDGRCGFQGIMHSDPSGTDPNDGQESADIATDPDLGAIVLIIALLLYLRI